MIEIDPESTLTQPRKQPPIVQVDLDGAVRVTDSEGRVAETTLKAVKSIGIGRLIESVARREQ